MIDKSEIRRLIPHSGTMCLLDGVVRWDDDSIVCITNTHRDANNPLRRDGQLSAVHALEYGAQAAAIHGGLRARAAGTTAPARKDARLTRVIFDHQMRFHLNRIGYVRDHRNARKLGGQFRTVDIDIIGHVPLGQGLGF